MVANMSEVAIDALFSTMAAATAYEEVTALLWMHYRIRGQANKLNSERDENFHILAEDGREYVLKLTHPAESREVTDFQTQALLHAIERDPLLPIPKVVPRLDGEPYGPVAMGDGTERVLRLLTYLPGQPLYQISRSAPQRRHLGQILARLDRALSDFEHPAAHHRLLWDIQHAEQLKPLLLETPPSPQGEVLGAWLDHYETQVRPALPGLRRQVIHNDLNPYNVLVDPSDHATTAGIIDFGDMVHAPMANELAVACSYQLSGNGNPLDTAAEMVGAYHEITPLSGEEIDLLYDLILTRLCMTVTITNWRANKYPENKTYILRNNGLSWDGFQRLAAIRRQDAVDFLRHVCGMKG